MKYRIYVMTKGFNLAGSRLSYEEMIYSMDHLIYKKKFNNRILVIEHDPRNNSDMPYYEYTGNIKEYEEFKKAQEGICTEKQKVMKIQ